MLGADADDRARAVEERRAVPESYAARGVRRDVLVERGRAEGSVVTAASPTHAVLPARDPWRVAATPRRVLATTKCGASTETLALPACPRRRRCARARSTAAAASAGCRVRAGSSHAIACCVR